MKNLISIKTLFALTLTAMCFFACKKDLSPANSRNLSVGTNSLVSSSNTSNVMQVNLVADTQGFWANLIDPNLANAWGIAAPPNGPIWISANHTGVSTIYNRTTGQTLRPPVTIPAAMAGQTGAPTGVIFNGTTDFGGNKFIFAGEDGIIAAWKGGNVAAKVADRSQFNAVYKGLTMGNDGTGNFLYVANFKGGKIDVFNREFHYVTDKPFIDPNIPAGYAPFNIQNIRGRLYVTYALQKEPDHMDDQAGPGNGYVDIFSTSGVLLKRFASRGTLNSPWGIALAPPGFASSVQTILVGNFGDGQISIFNNEGTYLGQLQSQGKPVWIDGLWAIDFLKGNVPGGSASDWLYFTSGPDDESHGLFGYLQAQ